MLRISKMASYATAIMTYLAQKAPHKLISAKDIASQVELAAPTVAKILKLLVTAKLLCSTQGSDGGYALARPVEDVTIADIIVAVDGDLAVTACCDKKHRCMHQTKCVTRSNWQIINHTILQILDGVTLCDMSKSLKKNLWLKNLTHLLEQS